MSEFERQIYADLKSTDRVSLWVAKCMELAEFSCILTDEDIDGIAMVGYSKLFFANLSISLSNSFSHAKVALSDVNGNVVQQLIFHETGEAGGFSITYASSDIFTINAENGNYYLMLEVASGATGGGLHATIQMNGCYLI